MTMSLIKDHGRTQIQIAIVVLGSFPIGAGGLASSGTARGISVMLSELMCRSRHCKSPAMSYVEWLFLQPIKGPQQKLIRHVSGQRGAKCCFC
jgi:hypothetical protein